MKAKAWILAALALALAAGTASYGARAVPRGGKPRRAAARGITITPVTRHVGTEGGGWAIKTAGSGTWTASTGASWITLHATSGTAGNPVTYTVAKATTVEARTEDVYVSGNKHTVTQDGYGASISPADAEFGPSGGTGSVSVSAPNGAGWQARANDGWLGVGKTGGTGPGTLSYTVSAFDEVSTRQGTLTVAGNTFTVFQTGRAMKLAEYSASPDYLAHSIQVRVHALASTEWTVASKASWISVKDAGSGKGSGQVTLSIAENPSWKARSGTVSVGTETFTVSQGGRTALVFNISPTTATVGLEGGSGTIAVTATPDLPWSAASQAGWLTLGSGSRQGAGNGTVAYSAAPNPTLQGRTGTITVTPGDTSASAKMLTVTQPAAVPALSAAGYEFEAAGESCEVRVSVPDVVQWQVQNPVGWLKVVGSTSRTGPGTVTLQASPNTTVQPRSGTVTIALQTFQVTQKAMGVEVDYDTKLFGTDGGDDSFSVRTDAQVSWTAVSSDPAFITIYQGVSGTGNGVVRYIVSPYVGDGEARTGTITVGDKAVYISQRGYELSISPNGAKVEGNNGAGEFGVSAGIDDIWRAIVTEPWITIISGYDPVTGSGIVRFSYTDNDTGKTRTGKIIVAGEVYTLEQKARKVEAFPSANSDDEVADALAGAADARLAERLATVAAYDTFRQWVEQSGLDPWVVKMSAHAWPTYLLGAEALFTNEPVIVLDGLSVETGATKAAGRMSMGVSVTVKDGGTAVTVDAGKVAALFVCTDDLGDWTGGSLPTVTRKEGEGATMRFKLSPGGSDAGRAFLRLVE